MALQAADFKQQVARFSPAGRVPVLLVGETAIWDSLAIAEYLAELEPGLWPTSLLDRARARAISAEMHSGFQALRQQMPMNVRAVGRTVPSTPALEADIARIVAALPSASDIAAALLAALNATTIPTDVRKVNGDTIIGHGIPPTYDNTGTMTTPGDPWRPA